MILRTITGYEISIMPRFETTHLLPCRYTTLSLSGCEDEEAPLFLEHSEGSFTHEAMEVNMINGRHLKMRYNSSFLDDTFSMSPPLLKEKILPVADPKLHWFWRAFVEKRIPLRDLIGGAL